MSETDRICPKCGGHKPLMQDACWSCRNPEDPDIARLTAENERLRALLHALVIHTEEAYPEPTPVLGELLGRVNYILGRFPR